MPYRNPRRRRGWFVHVLALLLASLPFAAGAAPTLRMQVIQHGDFVLVGNTLGHDCAAGTPAPVTGSVMNCGSNLEDSAPDVFWRSDAPASGQAQANGMFTVAQARSTAILVLPPGAQVTHAWLYWAAATSAAGNIDTFVTVERPGAGGFSAPVTAQQSWTGNNNAYASMADVTALVSANGSGAYRVSGVDAAALSNLANDNVFAAWWMVVLYERASDPLRSLAVYDGLDAVANGAPADITLAGFLVPQSGYTARLGVVALEGDNTITGDQLAFNGVVLANAQNPANNFFNGTRSHLGAAVSTIGDLPQLTGGPQSMSGIDMDVVDVTAQVGPGQTAATVHASSSGDAYHLANMIVAIDTFLPQFGASTMSVTDLDGGALMPGDTLQYTIRVVNDGNDAATGTWLEHVLPAELSYVPGSLQVTDGPGAGAKTDAAGDDQAEYVAAGHKIVARLGVGADASQGGMLAVNSETTFRFRAVVGNANACTWHASVATEATLRAVGQLGGATVEMATDGDAATPGQQPTQVSVDVDCLSVHLPAAPVHGAIGSDIGFACAADTCSQAVVTGTLVSLEAHADPGYVLDAWTGDCAADGASPTATLVMEGSRSCGASFIGAPHAVRVNVSGLAGSGLVLRLDGSEDLAVPGNGAHEFTTQVRFADPYAVIVATQPASPKESCAFSPATPPSGTVPDADIELELACSTLQPHLSLAVSDGRDHARYGSVVDYVVTLTNDGDADAVGVDLAAVPSSQLDDAQTEWACVGAGGGATCTEQGSGRLADDGIVLPVGRSLTWLVSAPLPPDAPGPILDYTVNASGAGAASATDSDILVLLRTGFDVDGSDGAE